MNFFKRYGIIIILWIIVILIITLTWGSGRFYMIFPAFLTTIGWFLTIKAIEGKKTAEKIKSGTLSKDKTGLYRLEGVVQQIYNLTSPINNKDSVFYDIVVEKGEMNYTMLGGVNPNSFSEDLKAKSKGAKWTVIGRKTKWTNFNIKDNDGKTIKVLEPELAEGQWVFSEKDIDNMKITTFKNAEPIIKEIVEDQQKNKKQKIEKDRYIRYLERCIEKDQEIIIYGTLSIDNEGNYEIKKGNDNIYLITNNKNYNLKNIEHKEFIKAVIFLVLGIIGLITAFFWPMLLDIARETV